MTSKVFPNGVRQLEISKPTKLGHKLSLLRGHIVLVAKFDFVAESDDELSVAKGDVLKLLDRLANGWVFVESIDKIDASGLVPSLYVDIAINDSDHPITMQWLHETKKDAELQVQNSFNDIQVQLLMNTNSPLTINNRPYPLAASVVNYLTYEDRFWYRVDVTFSTGDHGYLCRYYLDFFELHASLLENIAEYDAVLLTLSAKGQSETNLPEQPPIRLPRLPEPIMNQNKNPTAQEELFSKRCKELTSYLNILISDKRLQASPFLGDWLDAEYNSKPGFVAEKALNDLNEAICQRILPGSRIVASQMNTIPPKASDLSKVADASCYSALPKGVQRAKSLGSRKNTHSPPSTTCSSISRSASTRVPPLPQRSDNLTRTGSITISDGIRAAQILDPTFDPPTLPNISNISNASSSPHTPPKHAFTPPLRAPSISGAQSENSSKYSTPKSISQETMPSRFIPPVHDTIDQIEPGSDSVESKTNTNKAYNGKLLRCEIKTPANDVIIVKLKQHEVTSISQLKFLLSRKVNFNNVYIRFEDDESYEELEDDDFELFTRLKDSTQVYYLLT